MYHFTVIEKTVTNLGKILKSFYDSFINQTKKKNWKINKKFSRSIHKII